MEVAMDKKTRSNLGIGLLLILIGGWFLAIQFIPQFGSWFREIFDWPLYIIGGGLLFLVLGLISGEPGLVIPASIFSGIGGLLYYQNATNNWESWSYAWALIPGFVGIGVLIMALLGEGGKGGIHSGVTLIFISLVMFLIFGSFFGANPLGIYWPFLLIALGLWMLLQPFIKKWR
jgi:hypothetical protein